MHRSSRALARFLGTAAALTLGLGVGSGCDSAADSGGLGGGPDTATSTCLYKVSAPGAVPDFGLACTSDADCNFGECILPGDPGNITNSVFGFCTRGCDCNNQAEARLASSDPDYSCAYPGGCSVGESQGAWRHAVPKCSNVQDCKDLDERYTGCRNADCGQLHRVCHAE